MILEKLEIILSLLVGLVLTAAGLYYGTPFFELLIKLFVTMLIFYIIGIILKNYLLKKVFPADTVDNDKENADEHTKGGNIAGE